MIILCYWFHLTFEWLLISTKNTMADCMYVWLVIAWHKWQANYAVAYYNQVTAQSATQATPNRARVNPANRV